MVYKELTLKTQISFLSSLSPWQYVAAVSSAVAGIIHAYYMPEHFEMWVGYGLFFLVATVCQLLLSHILVAAPARREVLWGGILGNAAIIGMWVIARTIGNPLGPMTGEIEEIGLLDTASKIAELTAIVCLAVLLRAKTDVRANGNALTS